MNPYRLKRINNRLANLKRELSSLVAYLEDIIYELNGKHSEELED